MSDPVIVSLDFTAPDEIVVPESSTDTDTTSPASALPDAVDSPVASAAAPGQGATETVPRQEGSSPLPQRGSRLDGPSRLTSSARNSMALHTRAAFWIFNGQRGSADATVRPMVGGRRFAWAVRLIWMLSANDNPYADWMLIRIDTELADLSARLAGTIGRTRERIEALGATGLRLGILESAAPQVIALEFHSPYGYATATLIHEFDIYVRLVKTLVYADQLSDEEGRAAVRRFASPMRGLFDRPIPWQRFLLADRVRTHARGDFLLDADEHARARIAAMVKHFGQVPMEVLTGAKAPRHTRRRMRLSDAELQSLMQAAPVRDEDGEAAAEELL